MKLRFYIVFVLTICVWGISCKNSSKTENSSTEFEKSEENEYSDGNYCSEVQYYYPKTGTTSTYTLKVEVENNKLVKIFWNNGGWLDNSHFNPPDISDGDANFESDNNVQYKIKIIGKDGSCNYSTNIQSEEDLVQESEEKKIEGVTGVVIWESNSCDYVIIYSKNAWYVVAEKYTGAYSLSEGDEIRGDIIGFGFEDVYCTNRDKEMRLYIDNYYATKSSAEELIIEKCNLNEEE